MLLTVVKVVMGQYADIVDSLYDKEGFSGQRSMQMIDIVQNSSS